MIRAVLKRNAGTAGAVTFRPDIDHCPAAGLANERGDYNVWLRAKFARSNRLSAFLKAAITHEIKGRRNTPISREKAE